VDVSADEVALVRRCLRGDAEAVRTLVERFQAEVFGLSVRLLRHRQDAEDVTQEVFWRVFRSLRPWDSTRPLKPWIMGIVVNRGRTWLSRRAKRPDSVHYLQDSVAAPPTDDVAELAQEVQAALAELRHEYRAAFVMFHEQNQPYEDIARALDRPMGTVKTWLHRARLEVLARLRRRGMVATEFMRDKS